MSLFEHLKEIPREEQEEVLRGIKQELKKKLESQLIALIPDVTGIRIHRQLPDFKRIAQEHGFGDALYFIDAMYASIGEIQVDNMLAPVRRIEQLERRLEDWLETQRDLSMIEQGLQFKERQRNVRSGRLDISALDATGKPVIVELKASVPKSEEVYHQLMKYLGEHQDSRVIFSAPEIKPDLFYAITETHPDRVSFFENKHAGDEYSFRQVTREDIEKLPVSPKLQFKSNFRPPSDIVGVVKRGKKSRVKLAHSFSAPPVSKESVSGEELPLVSAPLKNNAPIFSNSGKSNDKSLLVPEDEEREPVFYIIKDEAAPEGGLASLPGVTSIQPIRNVLQTHYQEIKEMYKRELKERPLYEQILAINRLYRKELGVGEPNTAEISRNDRKRLENLLVGTESLNVQLSLCEEWAYLRNELANRGLSDFINRRPEKVFIPECQEKSTQDSLESKMFSAADIYSIIEGELNSTSSAATTVENGISFLVALENGKRYKKEEVRKIKGGLWDQYSALYGNKNLKKIRKMCEIVCSRESSKEDSSNSGNVELMKNRWRFLDCSLPWLKLFNSFITVKFERARYLAEVDKNLGDVYYSFGPEMVSLINALRKDTQDIEYPCSLGSLVCIVKLDNAIYQSIIDHLHTTDTLPTPSPRFISRINSFGHPAIIVKDKEAIPLLTQEKDRPTYYRAGLIQGFSRESIESLASPSPIGASHKRTLDALLSSERVEDEQKIFAKYQEEKRKFFGNQSYLDWRTQERSIQTVTMIDSIDELPLMCEVYESLTELEAAESPQEVKKVLMKINKDRKRLFGLVSRARNNPLTQSTNSLMEFFKNKPIIKTSTLAEHPERREAAYDFMASESTKPTAGLLSEYLALKLQRVKTLEAIHPQFAMLYAQFGPESASLINSAERGEPYHILMDRDITAKGHLENFIRIDQQLYRDISSRFIVQEEAPRRLIESEKLPKETIKGESREKYPDGTVIPDDDLPDASTIYSMLFKGHEQKVVRAYAHTHEEKKQWSAIHKRIMHFADTIHGYMKAGRSLKALQEACGAFQEFDLVEKMCHAETRPNEQQVYTFFDDVERIMHLTKNDGKEIYAFTPKRLEIMYQGIVKEFPSAKK